MDRSYDDEEFLPWYRRATPTWLELSAAARGVLISVQMELNQKTGGLVLRRGLESLSRLVDIPWEVLEPALAELVAAGKLVWNGSTFTLSDPDYLQRKRPSSTERVRKWRDSKRRETDETVATVARVAGVSATQKRREEKRTEENDTPKGVSNAREARDPTPPDWFKAVCDTIAATAEPIQDIPSAWLRYRGNRADGRKQMGERDAEGWLCGVIVTEQRKDREMRRQRDDRDRARAGPPPPRINPEQERAAFARVAQLVAAKREVSE